MIPVLRVASNDLVYVPDLVRYGSKYFREIADQDEAFSGKLAEKRRPLEDAVAYPPNQVFSATCRPKNWPKSQRPGTAIQSLGAARAVLDVLATPVDGPTVFDYWIDRDGEICRVMEICQFTEI